MNTYRVYQIQINDKQYHEVNAKGWEGVAWGRAYNKATSFLREANAHERVITCVDHDLVTHTATMKAEDLEDLFVIMNGMAKSPEVLYEAPRHKSLSVGDIVYCVETKETKIVCAFGYAKVTRDFQKQLEAKVSTVVTANELL